MFIFGYPLQALVYILNSVLFLYTIVIIASVVTSWLRLDPWHPVMRVLNQLTTPVYRRIRPFLPQTGQIDLTPLVVMLLIMFIQQGVLPIFLRLATHLIGIESAGSDL